MTGTIGHGGFDFGDLRAGLAGLVGRFGRLLGWLAFACLLALAVTVALLTTVVIGLVLALAALLLALGHHRPASRRPIQTGLEPLEARRTPEGWVIEPSSSAR